MKGLAGWQGCGFNGKICLALALCPRAMKKGSQSSPVHKVYAVLMPVLGVRVVPGADRPRWWGRASRPRPID